MSTLHLVFLVLSVDMMDLANFADRFILPLYQLAFISWLSLRQCWGKSRLQFLQPNASRFVDISCSSWTFGRFVQDVLYQASFMSPTDRVTQVLQWGFRARSCTYGAAIFNKLVIVFKVYHAGSMILMIILARSAGFCIIMAKPT